MRIGAIPIAPPIFRKEHSMNNWFDDLLKYREAMGRGSTSQFSGGIQHKRLPTRNKYEGRYKGRNYLRGKGQRK